MGVEMQDFSRDDRCHQLLAITPRLFARTKHQSALMLLLFCLTLPAVAQVDLTVHPAPDFGEGVVWLDEGAAAPHHIADYRGKVVLIDFWEYTCINCIRDFGVIKRWYTKYHP